MAYISDKTLMQPIRIGLVFSILTIVLYEFGVYKFPVINREKLNIFLIVTNLAMYWGFYKGVRNPQIHITTKTISIEKVVNVLFWISLIVAIPKYLLYTGERSFSIGTVLLKLATASEDALSLYMERRELGNATGAWKYINWIIVFVAPLHWAYMQLSMLFWKQLTLFKKICSVFIWFLYVAQYTVTGTNVGFFLFAISFFVIYTIRRTSQYGQVKRKQVKKRSQNKFVVVLIMVFAIYVIASFFDIIMGSRIGDNIYNYYQVNTDSVFWIMTPDSLKNLVANFTRYLAGGYNGLALSFSLPFETTFGFGHSFFLLDNIDPSRHGIWLRTYNMKIYSTFGYDWYANWHTSYLWYANDVSHFGVPIIYFILFVFFGRSWVRFKETNNIISFLIFMLFVKMMSFISANNLVFQQSETMMVFWILIVLNRTMKNYKWELTTNEI